VTVAAVDVVRALIIGHGDTLSPVVDGLASLAGLLLVFVPLSERASRWHEHVPLRSPSPTVGAPAIRASAGPSEYGAEAALSHERIRELLETRAARTL
jgi:hypothetical protein